jgi:hypothetical protein
MPASAVSQEVTVMLSPKKLPRVPMAMPPTPHSPASETIVNANIGSNVVVPKSQLQVVESESSSTCGTESSITIDTGDPFTEGMYIATHLRPRAYDTTLLPQERFCVPPETLKAYPPKRGTKIGWKSRSWYIVRRGLEIGIFFDYWFFFLLFSSSML